MRSRRTWLGAVAIALMLAACGGGSDDAEGDDGGSDTGSGNGSGASATLEVTAQDFQFSPNELSVEPASEVTIKVSNEGDAPHTFTAESVDVDVRVDPGSTEEATFTAPDDGTVEWFCAIHPQMTGTIQVGSATSSNDSGSDDGEAADDLDY